VPVHLYGQVADMQAILKVAERHGLMVVEDACQAHGAARLVNGRWQKAGAIGKVAAFSFYPGKNLGACGEAGAITTDDEDVARRVRMLRDHGQTEKYHHAIEGFNGRLDAIQAGFLRVKLRHLDGWNDQRRAAAIRYKELFQKLSLPSLIVPFESEASNAVYHLYVIRTPDRDALASNLKENRIGTGLHYPVPVHLQPCYSSWRLPVGSLPVTEKVASEVLSLPMFPGLQPSQQERVVSQIEAFMSLRAE